MASAATIVTKQFYPETFDSLQVDSQGWLYLSYSGSNPGTATNATITRVIPNTGSMFGASGMHASLPSTRAVRQLFLHESTGWIWALDEYDFRMCRVSLFALSGRIMPGMGECSPATDWLGSMLNGFRTIGAVFPEGSNTVYMVGQDAGGVHLATLDISQWPDTVLTASNTSLPLMQTAAMVVADPGNTFAYVVSLTDSPNVVAQVHIGPQFDAEQAFVQSLGPTQTANILSATVDSQKYLYISRKDRTVLKISPTNLAIVGTLSLPINPLTMLYVPSSNAVYVGGDQWQNPMYGIDAGSFTLGSSTPIGDRTLGKYSVAVSPGENSNTFAVLSFLDMFIIRVDCPAGQIANLTGSCFTCPAGSVSYLGDVSCSTCPAGAMSVAGPLGYNNAPCMPCPAGTRQPSAGSAQCIPCSSPEECPAGSKVALPEGLTYEQSSDARPSFGAEQEKRLRRSAVGVAVVASLIGVGGLIASVVLFVKRNQLSDRLSGLNLFGPTTTYMSLSEDSNGSVAPPPDPKRTVLGLIATIVCIAAVLIVFLYSVTAYATNNIEEEVYLVPGTLANYPPLDLALNACFNNYLGSCTTSSLSVATTGFIDAKTEANVAPTYQLYSQDSTGACCVSIQIPNSVFVDPDSTAVATAFITGSEASSNSISWSVTTPYVRDSSATLQGVLVPTEGNVFRSQARNAFSAINANIYPATLSAATAEGAKIEKEQVGYVPGLSSTVVQTSQTPLDRAFVRQASGTTGIGISWNLQIEGFMLTVSIKQRDTFLDFAARLIALIVGLYLITKFVLNRLLSRFDKPSSRANQNEIEMQDTSSLESSAPASTIEHV